MSEANSRVEEEPRYAPRQALLDLPAPLPLPGRIRVALFRGFAFARPRLKLQLRARQEIRCTFCCWPPGPLARRERRAYPLRPLRYVRSEQHSQRACGPQPGGARRRAGICGVAAPRRCHHIACVAAPCICPPGARAKMHTLFSDGPLASLTSTTCYGTRIFTDSNTVQPARNQNKPKSFSFLRVLRAFAVKSSPEFTAKTRSARREQECRQWLIEDGSLKTSQVRVASTSRLCVHVHRRLRRQGRERLCE